MRRSKKWSRTHRDLGEFSPQIRHSEVGPGGYDYQVQRVRGSAKTYRCPGCNQVIAAQVDHVVAWREESLLGWDSGVETRRHWHESCWARGLAIDGKP
ncbi:hypothetical protein [Scrofimicrobium sp. R131]|uniref:ATP/GTP-binding protein n=1 Tax=Scrofimicrobium appendicitidis TaxID=3079930 RepID=A0AAU7VAX6_9ACTO